MTAHEMKALIEQARVTFPDDRGRRCMFYVDFAERAWPNRGQTVGETTNRRAKIHVDRYGLFFHMVDRFDPRPQEITHDRSTDQASTV